MAESGINLAKAYVQIVPSADGIKGKLTSALNGEAVSAGNSAGATMGSSLASGIKKVIAAAGIGAAINKAISEGAALEQSIGGIETLFKDSADKMKEYAENAYATAGLSSNAYMEQATGFAASLLQSLNGNTEAAADAANQALIDMADNSNKMGTSLESIQNAYAGFAKQNYTMLDNLKLGYGGTKSEMERLLKHAQEISGVKYDINNLSDVYSAIHEIQKELEITGATGDEAMTTISGSAAAMKAAFTNVLGNLALGEDLQPSLSALVETTSTFLFNNMIPAVGNIITAIPSTIGTLLETGIPALLENGKVIISSIIDGITTNLPIMVQNGAQALQSFSEGLITEVPNLLENVLPILLDLSKTLHDNIGIIVDAGIELIINLVQGIAEGIPTLVEYVPEIISNIANTINDNLPKILSAGITIIVILIEGLIKSLPTIVKNIPKIVGAIVDTISAFNWLGLGKKIITFLGNGIVNMVSSIGSCAKKILDNIVNKFKNFSFADLGKNIVSGIINGIGNMAGSLFESIKGLAKNALNAAKSALGIHSPSKVFESQVGKMIDLGLAEGIENNVNHVSDAMRELSKSSVGMINTDLNATVGGNYNPDVNDNDILVKIYELLNIILPEFANLKVVLDTGTCVGALAPALDEELGLIATRRSRQ